MRGITYNKEGRRMRKRFNLSVAITFLLAGSLLINKVSFAHDLWIYVDNPYPSKGEKVIAKIMFGHKFPHGDILLSREQLGDFYYIDPDGYKKKITKIWEEKTGERSGALVGEITLEKDGSYIIIAYRKVKGDEHHVASEKYAKAICSTGGVKSPINKPLGHRIEIVPLKDPKDLKVGDNMPVKILFEGKPLSTYLYATYEGYHSEEEPFPITAKSDKNGIAIIKITKPGTWMFVCSHKIDFSATLTFKVKSQNESYQRKK
jgi:uncharacterized GH25 family protein